MSQIHLFYNTLNIIIPFVFICKGACLTLKVGVVPIQHPTLVRTVYCTSFTNSGLEIQFLLTLISNK